MKLCGKYTRKSRIEWAKNWTFKWFNEKRAKVIRRNEYTNQDIIFEESSTPKLKILDVGSCNGKGLSRDPYQGSIR